MLKRIDSGFSAMIENDIGYLILGLWLFSIEVWSRENLTSNKFIGKRELCEAPEQSSRDFRW